MRYNIYFLKNYFFKTCFLTCVFLVSKNIVAVQVSVKAEKYDKLKLKLVLVGRTNKKIEEIAQVIKRDLEFSGQFEVVVPQKQSCIAKKSDITRHFEPECRLGIFLTKLKRKTFGWRLYDLEYAQMVKGEKYIKKGKDTNGWAHSIADAIWPNLTGEKGFFSTKIVYSKKIEREGQKAYKHIYIADYDGHHESLLVSTPTVNVAPRWNNDPKKPLVFYSEHTNKNVRLMVADMAGRRKMASNFDGLNILSAFSPDGKRFAYCASRGDGECQIYYYDGELKKLTHTGNNIAPTFADNGNTLYFCSDSQSKCPQIYKYDLSKRNDGRYRPACISRGGFQVATVFSPAKNLLAYAKMVQGVMQIFVYDPALKVHAQVTFGQGNKEECSWSPCGNYMLFSVERNNKSRLAVKNLLTGSMRFITNAASSCYYPFWSPVYNDFPVVSRQ
ncbi:hypothetical protein ACFLYU_01710 [Candidatus Dependentiae bacterium]